MEAFAHVIGLLALIFVIALALLLERASELIMARANVKFSGLALLAAVNAVLLAYANWLSLWEVRHLQRWPLLAVTLLFLFVLAIFFVCALALPRPIDNSADLEAHYWRERRTFYFAWLVSCLLAVAANLSLAGGMTHQNLINENLTNLLGAAAAALALATSARWAQWGVGVALTVLQVGFLVAFDGVLA